MKNPLPDIKLPGRKYLYPAALTALACTTSSVTASPSSLKQEQSTPAPLNASVIMPEGVRLMEPPQLSLPALKGSAASSAARSSSLDDLPMGPTIKFDLEVGTEVTDQFATQGIVFGGSGPKVIEDGVADGSPVLSGTPDFDGDISGYFVNPQTGEPDSVYVMVFDIGGFDETESVLMEFFDPEGDLVFQATNSNLNFVRQAAFGGNKGIASWRFSNLSDTNPDGFGIDNITFSTPGELNLGEELGIVGCSLGNPVNPAVGNKYQIEVDYKQSKPFPLKVERSYNSISGAWQFFMQLDHVFGSDNARVIRPDGKRLTFTRLLDSYWISINPSDTNTIALSFDEHGEPNGWQYQTLEDMTYTFDTAGRLTSVANRAGISHSYNYDTDKITVTHSLGGAVVFHLNINGRIEGFTDPDGFTYSYSYNGDGLITAATYPSELGSPQKLYRYENADHPDLLTSIWYNNTEDTYLYASWEYDSQRRATRSAHDWDKDVVTFDYTWAGLENPQITTTNALGKDTTYHFTTLNGTRKAYYVSGHESDNCQAANQAYGYYRSGFIYSKRDWNGITTVYQRNSKGQELKRTEALGTPEQRTITTTWHSQFNLPTSIMEPGKQTSFTYDGVGNLIHKQIEDIITP